MALPIGCPSRDPLPACGRRRFDAMDTRDDISEFLTSRRAKLTPAQVGLPDFGGRRRVPGLRREEVALVAGMSARVLQAPRARQRHRRLRSRHRRDQPRPAARRSRTRAPARPDPHRQCRRPPAATSTRPRKSQLTAGMQQTIDAMSTVPVFVQNGRLDAVATNRLGRALFSEMLDGARPAGERRPVHLPRPQARRRSTGTGRATPGRSSPSFAPKPAAHPTTGSSATSSANSPPAAICSASSGAPTTSASTAPASRAFTILSSATSTSPSRAWTSHPTAACRCSSSPPNPDLRHTTDCSFSPTGRRRTRRARSRSRPRRKRAETLATGGSLRRDESPSSDSGDPRGPRRASATPARASQVDIRPSLPSLIKERNQPRPIQAPIDRIANGRGRTTTRPRHEG